MCHCKVMQISDVDAVDKPVRIAGIIIPTTTSITSIPLVYA